MSENRECRSGNVLYLWSPQITLCAIIHHKHILGLHQLLLHPARRNEDVVMMLNARPAAGSGHLLSRAIVSSEKRLQRVIGILPSPKYKISRKVCK